MSKTKVSLICAYTKIEHLDIGTGVWEIVAASLKGVSSFTLIAEEYSGALYRLS